MEALAPVSAERCAVLAYAVDEPQAGTAPTARRWACLEHRGAWPRDLAHHRDPDVVAFAVRANAAGFRVQLIRRPGRQPDLGRTRVYLADTTPRAAHTTMLTVEGPAELASVPLPTAGEALPGAVVADPLLLVCTHGRRDRCCALDGRTLTKALVDAGEPHVWESSHLGGHRFAPTALVLPTGYLYGRLDVATAVAARKAAALGEVETALCRGRATWSPQGQVAELAVRAATGLRGADALTVRGTTVHDRDGRTWEVEVEEQVGSARPTSCGALALPSVSLRATAVIPSAAHPVCSTPV
jgi:hypothetical protein